MGKSADQLILYKTLISDNGIDRVSRPVLEKEEYERRKREAEKVGSYLVNEHFRIQNKGKAEA